MFFISTEKFFSFSRYSNLCLDFLITWKSGLIRRIRLISKFVTSQPGKQTIAIHILFNISRSKGNQTMKWNIRKQIFSFKNHAENEAGTIVPYLFLFFEKALYEAKSSGVQLSQNLFQQPSTFNSIKTNCMKLQTTDPEICSILIFQKSVCK